MDSQIKSSQGKLNRLLVRFATSTLDTPIKPDKVWPFLKKDKLSGSCEAFQKQIRKLKEQRK